MMKIPLRFLTLSAAFTCTLAGVNAVADTSSDTGFLQCFYECKLAPPGAPSYYQEQTTLMIMNGDQPTSAPPHPTTRVAYIAIMNANERILGFTRVGLTPRDLDELNVCHTITRNTGAAPPPAGVVLVAIDSLVAGVPPRDVDVAVKNPVGRMSLDDPEVFNGRIAGVGKTSCFEVNANPARLIDELVSDPSLPVWEPVLIEQTADTIID